MGRERTKPWRVHGLELALHLSDALETTSAEAKQLAIFVAKKSTSATCAAYAEEQGQHQQTDRRGEEDAARCHIGKRV